MKQEHEESGATRFTQVLRIRWDAMCEVPAIHQLARLIHSAGTNARAFACATRSPDQAFGIFECGDTGWLASRMVSDSVFESVEEYTKCSRLLELQQSNAVIDMHTSGRCKALSWRPL